MVRWMKRAFKKSLRPVDRGQHNSKSISLDNAGNIYVNIGCPSNDCQVEDRTKGSPGQDPCPLIGNNRGHLAI
jgi:hypothetical protein